MSGLGPVLGRVHVLVCDVAVREWDCAFFTLRMRLRNEHVGKSVEIHEEVQAHAFSGLPIEA